MQNAEPAVAGAMVGKPEARHETFRLRSAARERAGEPTTRHTKTHG